MCLLTGVPVSTASGESKMGVKMMTNVFQHDSIWRRTLLRPQTDMLDSRKARWWQKQTALVRESWMGSAENSYQGATRLLRVVLSLFCRCQYLQLTPQQLRKCRRPTKNARQGERLWIVFWWVVKSILYTLRHSPPKLLVSWLVEREVCLLLNGRQDHAPQSSPSSARGCDANTRKFGNRTSRAYSKLMSYQCHRATVTQAMEFGDPERPGLLMKCLAKSTN